MDPRLCTTAEGDKKRKFTDSGFAASPGLGYVKPYEVPTFWEDCFPHLFPYGTGGPDAIRRRPLSQHDFDKHCCLEKSGRFSACVPWLCQIPGPHSKRCFMGCLDSQVIQKQDLKMRAKEEAAELHEMTRKKLFYATMSIFGSREVSAQEVSWFILGFPFVC